MIRLNYLIHVKGKHRYVEEGISRLQKSVRNSYQTNRNENNLYKIEVNCWADWKGTGTYDYTKQDPAAKFYPARPVRNLSYRNLS